MSYSYRVQTPILHGRPGTDLLEKAVEAEAPKKNLPFFQELT